MCSDIFKEKAKIYLLVFFNADVGVGMIKSDKLDDVDWITFIVLICCDGINLDRFCSFVVGKSKIGTDNDIGEDFDVDCSCVDREAKDLFLWLFCVLITGDGNELLLGFNKGAVKTFEVIIVVVPHKRDADRVLVNIGHGLNDASV